LHRIVRPEILDTDQASPEDVRDSLVDLQRINRWFGGISTTAKVIDIVLEKINVTELTLLDVASASGDIPHSIQQRLAPRGVRLSYVLLDRDASHFVSNGAPRVRGDALALPFRDNSFDLVSCALFAHHLESEEIAIFAREALRVSRIALLINDLRRSRLHLAAIYAGKPLFNWITRHDSVASVRRAYTPEEMCSMLNHGTAREITITNTYLFRMGAIAWK
jgi:hypothetical protein